MKRIVGRNIYITDLRKVLAATGGVSKFATRCEESRFSAVWIRLARGARQDANLSLPELKQVQTSLRGKVEVWGWHVPFCKTQKDAETEANNIVKWVGDFGLDGILEDAERTHESPRFQGEDEEAKIYSGIIRDKLQASGCGIALSSHDQPQVHEDFPFAPFLERVADVCPQVYYRSADVATRLNASISGYRPLEAGRDFNDRYKPTGNITMADDLPMPSEKICLEATRNFVKFVKDHGYKGYSFWCWDTAPEGIWSLFKNTPV